jgi:hypothetical protein
MIFGNYMAPVLSFSTQSEIFLLLLDKLFIGLYVHPMNYIKPSIFRYSLKKIKVTGLVEIFSPAILGNFVA